MVTGTSAQAGTPHTREKKPPENELLASALNVHSHIDQKSHLTPEASSTTQEVPLCHTCLAQEMPLLRCQKQLHSAACAQEGRETPPSPNVLDATKAMVTYGSMERNDGVI